MGKLWQRRPPLPPPASATTPIPRHRARPQRYRLDRFLVYGTGGVAFGTGPTINNFNPFLIGAGPFFNNLNNTSNWRVGYAVGGGVEYAFLNNWSVKLESLHRPWAHE